MSGQWTVTDNDPADKAAVPDLEISGAGIYDNGAGGREPLSMHSSLLTEALEEERRKSASLSAKLKEAHARNRQLEHFSNVGNNGVDFMRRHSTMREPIGNDSLSSSMHGLSYASLSIPECKPSEGEEDIDRKCFENWKDLFEASMQLMGVFDENVKMSIFKIRAGANLLEILVGAAPSKDTPHAELAPYSNAMGRLKNYFGSREYVLLQRQKLRSVTQNSTESAVKFVKRIIAIAKLCDFNDDQLVENIADVMQIQALDLKVRDIGRKILRKGCSLSDLLEKVRAFEIEKQNEELFARNHPSPQAVVAAVSHVAQSKPAFRGRSVNQYPGSNMRAGFSGSQTKSFGETNRSPGYRFQTRGRGFARRSFVREEYASKVACWRCTSKFHAPSECHAIEKSCRSCSQKGHLERACALAQPHVVQKRRLSDDDSKDKKPKIKKIAEVSEDADESENPYVSATANK